jgi:hypothetical protein
MIDIATASADEILADQVASLAVRRLCAHRDTLAAELAEAMGMATRNRTALTQIEKRLRLWESACTGRNGSQMPCVASQSDAGDKQ